MSIALTSSDESMRIWNFWPNTTVKNKTYARQPHKPESATSVPSATPDRGGDLYVSRYRSAHNQNYVMSELSLDASRVIK